MNEQYTPASGDHQVVFATTGGNCYYRIFRRRGSSTYRVELKTAAGYQYTAGLATQDQAEQWAIDTAAETGRNWPDSLPVAPKPKRAGTYQAAPEDRWEAGNE